jgi:serine O-acetyltransferase
MRNLTLSLDQIALEQYVLRQLNAFYPDGNNPSIEVLSNCVSKSLERVRLCFDAINLRYYRKENDSYFNHLHGDHYASFLYLMSYYAFKQGDENLASKLFLLNKAMFGIDAFYGIELPSHFIFVHPIGTILGNATYNDYFVVYQGVTIGSTTKGVYPEFSNGTILYANSSIIGECYTGENFVLAANASIVNKIIHANSVVLGTFPQNKILENRNNLINEYFDIR